MNWSVPRMWEGGDVWIIGGGPSVYREFEIPKEIVDSVLKGTSPLSVYSPFMKGLHDKHVIGVNAAYMLGDWIDIVFFGDSGFFMQHKRDLAMFAGLKVSCHNGARGEHWVKFLGRDGSKARGISSAPSLVSWNGNSGAAAISIAAHSGARRIMLLGFDMKLNGENRQHWHDVYHRGAINTRDDRKMRKLPFNRHLRGFDAIAADAQKMGIEIINCNPDSAITQFPKVSTKLLLG